MILEYPPEVINAGKGMNAETLKQKMEESALVIKTTYWYVSTNLPLTPILLEPIEICLGHQYRARLACTSVQSDQALYTLG